MSVTRSSSSVVTQRRQLSRLSMRPSTHLTRTGESHRRRLLQFDRLPWLLPGLRRAGCSYSVLMESSGAVRTFGRCFPQNHRVCRPSPKPHDPHFPQLGYSHQCSVWTGSGASDCGSGEGDGAGESVAIRRLYGRLVRSRTPRDDLKRVVGQRPLQRRRFGPGRPEPHIALLVRRQNDGHRLGMDWCDHGVRFRGQKREEVDRLDASFHLPHARPAGQPFRGNYRASRARP